VTGKEQGPKRNRRKHSARQGFSCTGKEMERKSWGQYKSKPPSLKEEKDLPDITRESRPYK